MKFPLTFVRLKPVGTGILLGADTFPVDANGTLRKPANTDTNVLFCKAVSKNGYPTKRVALAASISNNATTAPAALPVAAYVWDDALGFWIACAGSIMSITPGNTTSVPVTPQPACYFNLPALADSPPVQANLAGSDEGSLAVLFLVADNASANGTYTFTAAPVLNERAT